MMKRNFVVLFIFLLLAYENINGQDEFSGGSPYSIFGIGDLNYYTSTRTYSMGVLGTSLFGNYLNNLNPATMTKLNSTIIALNVNYGFLKSTNGTLENKVSNGNILGINIGIPFDQTNGWVFSLGFNPLSLINYKIRSTGSIGGQNFTQTYSGKGGLSRINAGMSYNLFQRASLGFEYNYAFGEIKNQNFIDFNNAGFTNTDIKKEIDFQKSFLKGGVILEIGKILRNLAIRDLSIGFLFQSGLNLTATQDAIYSSSLTNDTARINSGEIEIPDQYTIGITNIFARKYLVTADVLFQDWSKYREFGSQVEGFQNSIRAGLGVEIIPDPNEISFWKSMTYRFGGFYDKAFYKVSNEDIITYGFRTGVNIPLSKYNSIDFGVNYSIRGKTGNGLIKDEYLNFTVGINFGELWFIRPREEDQ